MIWLKLARSRFCWGNFQSFLPTLSERVEAGRQDDSLCGTFNFKASRAAVSEARLWNTRRLVGFYYPFPRHPAALKSLEEIFRQSRGEGNLLLFDLQSFLVKAFASLTHKHKFCQHSFPVYFCSLWVCLEHQTHIFLLTTETDVLPSLPVLTIVDWKLPYHLGSFPFL